jgi:hypothetical protein
MCREPHSPLPVRRDRRQHAQPREHRAVQVQHRDEVLGRRGRHVGHRQVPSEDDRQTPEDLRLIAEAAPRPQSAEARPSEAAEGTARTPRLATASWLRLSH